MPFAVVSLFASEVLWAILLAAAILLPLAWMAFRAANATRRDRLIGIGLRTLGVGLILFALLDPRWTRSRPKVGANLVALVADNSEGLQISDAGASETRGADLRGKLNEPGRWGDLEAAYQVRRYSFGDTTRRVADFGGLDFSEPQSALGAAIGDLKSRLAREPVAAIVLFTDGNATDLASGLPDLAGLPPVFPVVVGDGRGLRDARLTNVAVRSTPFDDAPVRIQVDAALHGDGATTASDAQLRFRTVASDGSNATAEDMVQSIRLPAGGSRQSAEFRWRPERPGLALHEVWLQPSEGETTLHNNRRLVVTDRGPQEYRILYLGGRINWEFKFLNRALVDDPQLKLVALLRLARREPKFEFRGRAGEAANPLFRGFRGGDDTTHYDEPVLTRLNTKDDQELRGGFPRTAAELFAYDAVILDDVESAFFSPDQLLLLRRFVSERGGGLLMLGGVDTLAHGGYNDTPLAAALPLHLSSAAAAKPPQGELAWQLTREGWLEPWTRIRDTEAAERERLQQMPRFLVANAASVSKPGATVLAVVEDETGESFPALVAQNFGRGRTAAIGIGDLWRWGLHGPAEQADLARFWRQISRWLVTEVPARVSLRVDPQDARTVELRVEARDLEFRPLEDATVQVTVRPMHRPSDTSGFDEVTLLAQPVPDQPGRFSVPFTPREAGAYRATADVSDRSGRDLGHAEAAWVYDPTAAEFASITPNRDLLEEIAQKTGGAVLTWDELAELPGQLSARTAPVMETIAVPLWHNGWIFVAILGAFAAEWFWRRRKGLP